MNRFSIKTYAVICGFACMSFFCETHTLQPMFLDPISVTAHIVFKNSAGVIQSAGSMVDEVDKPIHIGVALELAKFVDSVQIAVQGVNPVQPEQDTTILFPDARKGIDTAWYSVTMRSTGVWNVNAKIYVANGDSLSCKGQFTILSTAP